MTGRNIAILNDDILRELLNIFQTDEVGCRVITVYHDILKKLSLVGKDLDDYSLDTVKMFYADTQKNRI
jgi:transaldolase